MVHLRPDGRAERVCQPGNGDPRGRRIKQDARAGQKAHRGQRQGSPGSRSRIEHRGEIQPFGLRRGRGDHRLAECRRTGRRIVVGDVQKLHRAEESIAQAGKPPLDEQGEIDIPQALQPDRKNVAVESPSEHAQQQQRGNDPQAPVLQSQQIIHEPQGRHRDQQGRRGDAQSIDGRHSSHAASQGDDLLFERMEHGSRGQGPGIRGQGLAAVPLE